MIARKICQECGKKFQPRRKDQKFCKGPHTSICVICGKEFDYTCSPNEKPNTCSKVCKYKFMRANLKEKYGVEYVSQIPEVREKKKISNASEESQRKMKETCLKKYGVERAIQSEEVRRKLSSSLRSPEVREKTRQTFQQHYGVDHVFSSKEFREKYHINDIPKKEATKRALRRSVYERYGVTSIVDIPGGKKKSKEHREETVMKKYGENCIFKTKQFQDDMKERFGVENVMRNPDVLRKAFTNKQKKSSLELRLKHMLDAYNIKYKQEYVLKENEIIHSYDFYLPTYKILIDCDGEYWHSYLSDPDGDRVRDDYDDVRLYLVPKDHIFYLIIESDFERGLRGLQKTLKEIDSKIFDYDSDMFKWCRRVGFPYYNYTKDRMIQDFNSLYKYENNKYNPACKLGISIINNFHTSIYHCSCGNKPSPYEAWQNDELLKKVIANRYIYQNDVEPSKVMQGFNIAKIAPKVTVFNPVLAKYLCKKYASNTNLIVDPFSGFSGRLLGCYTAGKQYIGFDIRQDVVDESNRIIEFLHISNCKVYQEDLLKSNHTDNYSESVMLTCPPYSEKETYLDSQVNKSCDEWIEECLHRYHCNRYIFVVDETTKYNNCIVEDIQNSSHFSKAVEHVIVIDR